MNMFDFLEATPVEINQGIAARVRAVRKQGEQKQKADTHTGRKDLWSISFFIWKKLRMLALVFFMVVD